MTVMKKLILASSSPRRKELLGRITSAFEIKVIPSREVADKAIPSQMVMQLAAKKALPVLAEERDAVVIGADTVVVLGKKILGKPRDAGDAKQMLRALSGKKHAVMTGVCIASGSKIDMFFVRSDVFFDKLTDQRIDEYVATGLPMDKAGAYGIQDSGFVNSIKGSYTNVMGLPLERLKKHLANFTEENDG